MRQNIISKKDSRKVAKSKYKRRNALSPLTYFISQQRAIEL